MHRYFIFLQYKGTAYHGWQKQPNGITVQQILEEKLSILLRIKIETTGAGRTDTGVHAREFVAHFDLNYQMTDKTHFLYKINGLLPYDISAYDVREVSALANARFDAVLRSYEYHITTIKDPFLKEYAYFFPWTLDIEKMNEASAKLLLYTDFTSFSKLHTETKTNNCKIIFARWTANNNQLLFTITADRFLRNMVRAIVGTLIEVGKGRLSIDGFCHVIGSKNRCSAGVSVPAQGLYLTKIEYPANIFA
jgi:tRNA pseudouridine38-40 synthase